MRRTSWSIVLLLWQVMVLAATIPQQAEWEDPVIRRDTITACDSIFWQAEWHTQTTTLTERWLASNGVDSIQYHYLVVRPSSLLNVEMGLCAGDSLMLPNGTWVREAGVFDDSLHTRHGCDSIVRYKVAIRKARRHLPMAIDKCPGELLQLTLDTDPPLEQISWSTGETAPSVDTREMGMVVVRYIDRFGCQYTEAVDIRDAHCAPCPIFVPNAVTINGDFINESFGPRSNCSFVYFRFTVYNRLGEQIFETSDPLERWDGTYQGEPVVQETYLWVVRYTDTYSLSNKVESGTVLILR